MDPSFFEILDLPLNGNDQMTNDFNNKIVYYMYIQYQIQIVLRKVNKHGYREFNIKDLHVRRRDCLVYKVHKKVTI
jgi:hypothetical protein